MKASVIYEKSLRDYLVGKELDHICITGRWLWQQHEQNLTGESGSRKWDRKLL